MFLVLNNNNNKKHFKNFHTSSTLRAFQGVSKGVSSLAPGACLHLSFPHDPGNMVVNKFFNLAKPGLIFHTLTRVVSIS